MVEDHAVNMLIAAVSWSNGAWKRPRPATAPGVEAVRAAASIDIILMDVHMPVMGATRPRASCGARLLGRAAAHHCLSPPPPSSPERDDALAAGMNDFLTKLPDPPVASDAASSTGLYPVLSTMNTQAAQNLPLLRPHHGGLRLHVLLCSNLIGRPAPRS